MLSGCSAEQAASDNPAPAAATTGVFASQVRSVREGRTDWIAVETEEITDEGLRQIRDLTGLRELLIEQSCVTDAGLDHLSGMAHLEHLRLRGAAVTNAGICKLTHLKRLRILNLPQAEFSDAALAELVSLPDLELLRFGSPNVTDAGLAHLRRMANLRFVHIIDSPITDRGLRYFEGLVDLESLYLDGTDITDAGTEWLLKALPDLHVHINQQHADFDPRKGDHCALVPLCPFDAPDGQLGQLLDLGVRILEVFAEGVQGRLGVRSEFAQDKHGQPANAGVRRLQFFRGRRHGRSP